MTECPRLPLRIVHTEASQGWGGQEIRILSEARAMIARGHQVTLLAPATAKIHAVAQAQGIPAVALPIGRKNIRGVLALRKWLATHEVDVINTHSSTDTWLAALANLTLRHAAPIVRTRHISAPVATSWPNRWLYGRTSAAIATTGERLRRDLMDRLGLAPEHVVSVPTGIDLARFSRSQARARDGVRAELGIGQDALVIGIAATLRSWKGHDYLLDAFSALAAQYPRLELLVAGDGPRREHLEQRIAATDLAQRIHLIGQREDVPDILAAMDIFALPSYANEGVPQAIMQAMAMELPVISTRVGAIDEAVADEETGFLVPPRDSLALAEKIRALAENEALRMQLGQAGRAWAEGHFSLEAMAVAMEEIFYRAVAAG